MTASTAGTPPATDLAATADRLARAADSVEQLIEDAGGDGYPLRWEAKDGRVVQCGDSEGIDRSGDDDPFFDVARDCTPGEAAHVAAFDPYTVAALVPLLGSAAGAATDSAERAAVPGTPFAPWLPVWVAQLDTFARRLLGEEEE